MQCSENHKPASCPTCEFTHGISGASCDLGNGVMQCNRCKTKWRVLGASDVPSTSPNKTPANSTGQLNLGAPQSALSLGKATVDLHEKTQYQPQSKLSNSASAPKLFGIGIAATLFVIIGFQYFPTANINTNFLLSEHSQQLILDDIKIENVQNANMPIWVISARISNPSAHTLQVPPVLIRSGVKGSGGYLNRTYQPALQNLASGSSLMIRTLVRRPVGNTDGVELKFVDANLNSG